ncbi:immunoglobulin superfamily member 5 isoform 2-T2 [Polymixia lowei]
MDNVVLLVLHLACMSQVGAQVQLEPETLTVLKGEEARLTCSASVPWTVMVWLLNDSSVLTISSKYGVLPSNNPNVTAENRSTPQRSSWVFILRRTERHHQGQVTCDLQNIQRRTASLFVQEKGSVEVSGGNRTVLRGQWVLFECQATGWYPKPRLGWSANGIEVGQGEYNISSEVSAEGLFTLTSNLSMQAMESSHLECLASVSALSEPLTSHVRLTVVAEVLQEKDDCSVLLALTATLSAILLFLLLLLCVCIVLCYRRRRQAKSSQQPSVRFDQSVSGQSSVAEVAGGKVNLGYSTEGLADNGHNNLIKESTHPPGSVSVQKRVANLYCHGNSCVLQIPDVVSSSNLSLHSQSQAQVNLGEESSRATRRVTTV